MIMHDTSHVPARIGYNVGALTAYADALIETVATEIAKNFIRGDTPSI